ncbi:hypothetical protein LTR66_000257 [Elasticomyces elasticus]|nr:hypothetical protein LTR66_000257 [Elasticomyces elasticus]
MALSQYGDEVSAKDRQGMIADARLKKWINYILPATVGLLVLEDLMLSVTIENAAPPSTYSQMAHKNMSNLCL